MGKRKQIAAYVRVSTTGQDVRSQEPDLRAWVKAHGRGAGVVWYRDTFTGRTFNRPGMVKLEEHIKAGKVGTLVVWRLDRLGTFYAITRQPMLVATGAVNIGASPA